MKTKILSIQEPTALAQAIDVLTAGGLVAFPTDTIYGIGAFVFNEEAVGKIYEVKGRGQEKAIPVLVGELSQLERITAGMNHWEMKVAEHFWPGPLTLVLPRHPSIPNAVSSLPTIGVRIPNFSVTLDFLKLTGPLAVSSANIIGQAGASTAAGVMNQFKNKIDLILDGGVTPGGMLSTVVDCSTGEPLILREGQISQKQLEQVLKS